MTGPVVQSSQGAVTEGVGVGLGGRLERDGHEFFLLDLKLGDVGFTPRIDVPDDQASSPLPVQPGQIVAPLPALNMMLPKWSRIVPITSQTVFNTLPDGVQ